METKAEYAVEVVNTQVQLGSLAVQNSSMVIGRATELAKELARLIDDRKLFNNISGRKYVRVDGWATLGAMLGVLPREISVVEHDSGDFEATVELVRASDGQIIGRGSAIVGADENTWKSRPRYARRSMAITRATGKAFRLGFSWIMTLAGYEPTPAEEMDGIIEAEVVSHRPASPVKKAESVDEGAKVPSQPPSLWGDPDLMTLEMANGIVGSDGKKYGDCTDADLNGKIIGINKALKSGKYDSKQQDEALKKLRAVNMIISSRQSANSGASSAG